MDANEHYPVIIPACDEEPCLAEVLDELRSRLEPAMFPVVVGVNGSTDRTADVARAAGVRVAETSRRGYGYGCRAAIDLVRRERWPVDGFIFFAADGANDPADAALLVAGRRAGAEMVLGDRTRHPENRRVMGSVHVAANRLLGLWAGWLSGHPFRDLGPLRLIGSECLAALDLREMTYGWTIEAQVRAARMGARVVEVPVRERPRRAGRQKVSQVSVWHAWRVGWQIACAGWRARWRVTGNTVDGAE
jgi:glycosyltransferase involved in cell wall biosynthesis